jgi:uncharacterized membrane protein HdeD (DUF308 family)
MPSSPLLALSRFWWLFIAVGVVWVIIALVILQFDQASVTTVGVLIGILLIVSSIQNFALGAMVTSAAKWIWWAFGVLLLAGGIISFISPENTFAALADILGFIFLVIGVFWILDAFVMRGGANPLWWLGLISGILLVILAFWTGGQFFIEKSYLLLVFAGIWALLHGVTDIVRGFQLHTLAKEVETT